MCIRDRGNYYAAGTGLLFCFTYLFVALSKFLKASPIPFAWFSTFVAINAVIFGTIEGFTGSTALGKMCIRDSCHTHDAKVMHNVYISCIAILQSDINGSRFW